MAILATITSVATPARRRAHPEVPALHDVDGEPGDGRVVADGEEHLRRLVRLADLDVLVQVGRQVHLPLRDEVDLGEVEDGLTDGAVLAVHVDVEHQEAQAAVAQVLRGDLGPRVTIALKRILDQVAVLVDDDGDGFFLYRL